MREVPAEMAANLAAAADRLLASYDTVQMHDIAVDAGVARSSLYYYFMNKDDVLVYLLRSNLDELIRAAAMATSSSGTAAERLFGVIRALFGHLNQHPAASQQLFANLGRVGKLPEIAAKVEQGFEGPVRKLLAEGVEDGSLRSLPDDPLGATALFGAVLVIGLRALVVDGRIDIERAMQSITPMFWNGIAPDAPT